MLSKHRLSGRSGGLKNSLSGPDLCFNKMVCKLDRVATAAGCTVLCPLVVVVVLFENSIVCQCTFFKYFFHAPWHVDTAAVFVVVVLWCLLFVCTSSLRLDAFFVGVFVWLAV